MTINDDLITKDKRTIWHPYTSMFNSPEVFLVESASGVRLKLADGTELIDGMASWWCAIHGYNHPQLNAAIHSQLDDMAHVMFGGLTHSPAIELADKLVSLAPPELEVVFFSDSGSVSVEVAIKMAIQFWAAKGKTEKQKMLTIKSGYHGDTLGAMAVSDPETGMHSLFNEVVIRHFFAEQPKTRFDEAWQENDISSFNLLLEQHDKEIAAVILEPIVQGAGGMWFYSPMYLKCVRELCDRHDVLLICDEIATGFGRSGKMFACEHADISPDIMCVGKALTGGYMTMAATLCTRDVANTISDNGKGTLMHGPTFMANPLACSVANANIKLLQSYSWEEKVAAIELQMRQELEVCRDLNNVKDVRVLGAIGVVELDRAVDMHTISNEFVKRGVWIRPFNSLVYIMPPYLINPEELTKLTAAIYSVIANLKKI